MQERHVDRKRYFTEQGETTRKYVIPYIDPVLPITPQTRVMEVGCGEGGNLIPFVDMGCETVGIDISAPRVESARTFFAEHPNKHRITWIANDIYDVDPAQLGQFDLIFLRDVIEHIPNQERFLEFIKAFLKPEGVIFFGFPPWTMPFGGHQQVLDSKWASRLPYYHILPYRVYNGLLRLFGVDEKSITALNEVKETGLSTYRFHRMLRRLGYTVRKETYYLINPNYETKFNLKKRELWPVFRIPYLSDFYTTALYCIISK